MNTFIKYFAIGAASMLAAEKLTPMVSGFFPSAGPFTQTLIRYGVAGTGAYIGHKLVNKVT